MNFLKCAFGPALYAVYKSNPNVERMAVEVRNLEKYGDFVLKSLSLLHTLAVYTSPLVAGYLYRKGYLHVAYIPFAIKFTTTVGVVYAASIVVRAFGRMSSESYLTMLQALERAKSSKPSTIESRRDLRAFDIDFKWWPVDFDVNELETSKAKHYSNHKKLRQNFALQSLPCDILAYVAIHTFGISMIYPGSVGILKKLMNPMFLAGRAKLIENNHALRYKVKTIDANEIDAIFVDNRNSNFPDSKGNTLVICCEGNAGFYEVGIISTPLDINHSVLGWNHPGFACSTGRPFPEQDQNAVDAIVQFAIHHLGFALEDIMLYGWSIGGYSALYAATCYPDVKGVVLDATFDDILYLAIDHMPLALSPVVRTAIRKYCNLHNSELALKYHGPIRFIRRTEDEIIARDGRIETNRGNFLVLDVLQYRYPYIFKESQTNRIKSLLRSNLELSPLSTDENSACLSRFIRYASDHGKSYPMDIGADYSEEIRTQLAVYLLFKHLFDFKTTHCTPLNPRYFDPPLWDIPTEKGYVLT